MEQELRDHEARLNAFCREWVGLLALHEWNIEIHVYDEIEETSFNETKVKIVRNVGQAYIPFPHQRKLGDIAEEETDLLHYLLLIRFEMVNNESIANEIYYQRAVRILAQTLYDLKGGYDNYRALVAELTGLEEKKEDKKEYGQKKILGKVQTGRYAQKYEQAKKPQIIG